MAHEAWTVKDLMEALKRFPVQAKVHYEMGPNGPGTIRRGAIRQGLGRRGDGSAARKIVEKRSSARAANNRSDRLEQGSSGVIHLNFPAA